ncbi:MAG: hypothetical protein BWZ09_01894 [Alphaproteobacteria bacterium ADurb.BinA305]|nr:MAG: hypothetical protein BWZ09_01894 [Alphaproteobacteria bacterium ADurb.BinA305]
MSTVPPSEMTEEKPTSLVNAQSSTTEHIAPDCEIRAISPGLTAMRVSAALIPLPGRAMPRLPGPIRRSRVSRAVSTMRRSSAFPLALMMTALRTPLRPHCAVTLCSMRAGVAMMARSTGRPMSSTERWQGWSWMLPYFGLTAYRVPR